MLPMRPSQWPPPTRGRRPYRVLLDSPHLRLSRGLASISAFSHPPTGLTISGIGTPKKKALMAVRRTNCYHLELFDRRSLVLTTTPVCG
ncbi:hypothetical protein BGZ61DRAFT_446178 [Ilyonectria robusta]|uniref:uncharacterized protein n=1 Tax=Ilyonectria robusta TaxID=1079257 RepID=UPI001E8E620D|nr:uncharacterized protein BGZ61DRAFT_446178 [Ilyonectria robusta]KAH8729329.1 hypothetical protein BGZ61DRAFT_446178 [Ilyonectria robusta]